MSDSKKHGQTAVLNQYCRYSSFFLNQTLFHVKPRNLPRPGPFVKKIRRFEDL